VKRIQCQADRLCLVCTNSQAAVLLLWRAGETKAEDAADALGDGS
jgi:hypothetical protein